MRNIPTPGERVYINLHREKLPGVIVSEISGKLFDNPGFVYAVRLARKGRIYVKPISIYHLSERTLECDDEERLTCTKKLVWRQKGYDKFREHPYFYKKYALITGCRDGINRRKRKTTSTQPRIKQR